MLPPYGFASAVQLWTFNLPVTLGLLGVGVVYLAAARRARWAWWRVLYFVVLGLGGVAVCTMSSLAVYNHEHLWALGAQLTLLVTLVPVAIALGDPIGLARAVLPARARDGLDRLLTGPFVRVLTFPVVAALLATVFLVVVFFSPVLRDSLLHTSVMDAVYLAALGIGCLTALPMLGAEILPAWCTEPLRLVFAFADGLVDAVPGVLVMTTHTALAGGWFPGRADNPNWDVHTAGALMLALSEVVALPLFFLVFVRWAASEGAFDRGRVTASGRAAVGATRASAPAETAVDGDPDRQRPWWETEGFGVRHRPFDEH